MRRTFPNLKVRAEEPKRAISASNPELSPFVGSSAPSFRLAARDPQPSITAAAFVVFVPAVAFVHFLSLSSTLGHFTMATTYNTYVNGEELKIIIHTDGSVELNGSRFHVDLQHITGNTVYSMIIEGKSHEVFADLEAGDWKILLDGERYEVQVEDERTQRLKALEGPDKKLVGDVQIKAPMPGLVVKIPIEAGQRVAANQALVILEAMKMENELRAPRAGIIKEIRIAPRQTVELNQVLLILGEDV